MQARYSGSVFVGVGRARWCLLVALVGCGDAQLSNDKAGESLTVPADAFCAALDDGDALIGVSPEGEAWVEGDEGVRHIASDGTVTAVDAGFTRADLLVAWDAASAFVVGDNSLWATTFEGAEPMTLPPELGKPRFVCGDPSRSAGAFVITTRGLFERYGDVWLRWQFPVELLESMRIRDLQGACSGRDAVMYLEAGQSLWEVTYGDLASLREAADLTAMTVVGPDPRIGFVALADGRLVRFDGSRWVDIPFDEGRVSASSVADGVLWAAVDGALYRRNRFDEWEQLDAPMWPTPIVKIHGYAAGGAWVVRANQLCHVEPRETLRVRGLRPFERLPQGSALSVEVSSRQTNGSSLSARLNGGGVAVAGAAGAWSLDVPETLAPGWHVLQLAVRSPAGPVERAVSFLVEGEDPDAPVDPPPMGEPTVSWETDIWPLYERSCAACHGEEGNQTFMGNLEAFTALGELALDRVSAGEMPPPSASSVAPPLSEAETQLLETWVEEGMNP